MVSETKKGVTMIERLQNEDGKVGYLLLWLLGIPLPIILVLFLIFR